MLGACVSRSKAVFSYFHATTDPLVLPAVCSPLCCVECVVVTGAISDLRLAMTEKSDNVPAAASAVSTSEPGNVMDMVKQFDFLSIGLGGKIHCSLTNRDLPLRVDAVQQHLNSKKLKKEREW